MTKTCNLCGDTLRLDCFSKHKNGYQRRCKACKNVKYGRNISIVSTRKKRLSRNKLLKALQHAGMWVD